MTSLNFLDLWVRYAGVSEVPPQFVYFAGVSLLAATVADRVWLLRDAGGTKIYPNLYVFLIGPSGSGKERAITAAAQFAADFPSMGLYASTGVTKQYLIDHIRGQSSLVYLVTEELGMSIPSKELGRELIKFMTGHYIPSLVPMQEGTRTHGNKVLPPHCLNWLAGTTDEWLLQAVEKDAILGGFFARVLGVRGRRTGTTRCANITYPPDRDVIARHLQLRVEMYTTLKAQFIKSYEAMVYYNQWYEDYETRPTPTDPLLEAAFNRSDEMVHRLALILKLASMEDIPGYFTDIQIERPFFEEAVRLWESLMKGVPETVRRAVSTRESGDSDTIEEIVRLGRTIDHSSLLRKARNHGMNAERVKRALETLIQDESIVPDVIEVGRGKTKRVYVWRGE